MREFRQSQSDSTGTLQTKVAEVTEEKRLDVAVAPNFLPRLNSFFDAATVVAERSAELLSALEPAVLRLFLVLHLIIDLVIVFVVLLRKAG